MSDLPMFGSFEGEERIRREGGEEKRKVEKVILSICLNVLINNRREGKRYSSHCLIAG
jgi:hypothetical protein